MAACLPLEHAVELVGGTMHYATADGRYFIAGELYEMGDTELVNLTEATEAALRVAFELDGVDRVELHCSPLNAPSRAIPAKLGFVHEATLGRRFVDAEGDRHDSMIFAMFADDYAGSAVSRRPVEAYDVLGDRIL